MMTGVRAPEGYDYSAARAALQPFSVTSSSVIKVNSYTNLDEAPKNSVAVIQLKGPVIKNSQFCGPRGTLDIANDFNRAKANPNIIGAVLDIESGGGMALAVKPLTDAMQSFMEQKPIVGLSGDILASAGYYIASFCDEIIAQHPRSIIGSIGTMLAFADAKAMLEKQGIVFHEMYATKSTHKNKTFREASSGNYKPVIEFMLDPINEDFHADVREQRGAKLSSSEELIFKGETFMADYSVEIGLIDSLGSLQDAVLRVEELSAGYRSKNSNSKTQIKNMSKIANIDALAGVASPTQEQLDLANADLTTIGVTGATLVTEAFITEAAGVTAKNVTLTESLAAANTANKTASDSLVLANAKIIGLEAQVKAFGENAGATHQKAGGDEEPVVTGEEQDPTKVIAALAHNKAVESYL